MYESSNHTRLERLARARVVSRGTRVSFLNVFSGTANGPGNFDSPETHTKFMAENRRMNHVAIFRVMTAHETSFRVFGAEKAACRLC